MPVPAEQSIPAEQTTAAWRMACEHGDVDAAMKCLAPSIQIISPLTAAFRFHGIQQAREVIGAALRVIDGIRFHTDVGDERTRALFYRGRCGAQEVEEAQLVRLDESGQIMEVTLFSRPLPGTTALMARIGPALLRAQGRPVLGRLIGAATAPLAAVTRISERRLVPLADPSRSARRAVSRPASGRRAR